MRTTLLILVVLAFGSPAHGIERTLDPQLESRAREYFASFKSGDFGRVWELSSSNVRGDTDFDREAYVESMTRVAPYDLKIELVAGCSSDDHGSVFVEIQVRQNKADDWDTTKHQARWVRIAGDWFLDSMDEIPSFDEALQYCDRIPPSPN